MTQPEIKTSYPREVKHTILSIIKGHIVTFINLFRKKVTVQYPEQKLEMPEGYRGLPCLPIDAKTGQDLCIGCGACVRACPTQVLTVEAHMGEDKKRVVDKFELDAGRCIFCGLCEESCPVNAIRMSKEYELADFSRESLIYDRKRLNELGGVREPEPEQEASEEQEAVEAGKEDE